MENFLFFLHKMILFTQSRKSLCRFIAGITLVWTYPLSAQTHSHPARQIPFLTTLQKHLRAIEQRDFTAYRETIAKDDNIHLILPHGEHITGREPYLNVIREWFAEKDWTFAHSLQTINETQFLSSALLKVHYSDKKTDGQPVIMDYLLLLIFRKTKSGWKLIHDQNTLIQPTP